MGKSWKEKPWKYKNNKDFQKKHKQKNHNPKDDNFPIKESDIPDSVFDDLPPTDFNDFS